MKFEHFPARYALAILGMFGSFTKYMLSVNLNVAIVEMVTFDPVEVNSTEQVQGSWDVSNPENGELLCADSKFTDDKQGSSRNETKYLWTASQQGLVLGCFSYGDIAAQMGMAYLSRYFGHVRIVGISVFGGGVLTILTPILTESFGIAGLVAARILTGVLTGATTSLLMGLAGIWSPPQERSRIMSIMLAGVPLGITCVMPAAGVLAATAGWKFVFYVTGICGVFWAIIWMALASETPSDHPRISDHEKEYIYSSLDKSITEKKDTRRKVPWRKILTSGPVISINIASFCSLYGYQTLSSLFPTYLKTVQRVDTETGGMISAIPFATSGIFGLLSGTVADFFISRKFKVLAVRKAFTGVGMVISAIAIVGLGYSGCNLIAAATMATMVVAMDAFTIPGFKACVLDIAPNLSGVIFSLGQTLAMTTGFFAPQVTGVLREAYGFYGWQISFWIAAGLYLVGMGQFMIFGTNRKQAWADDEKKRPISLILSQETV